MSAKNTINKVIIVSSVMIAVNSYIKYKIQKKQNEESLNHKIIMSKIKKQEEYMTKDIADMIIEVNE
jgi:hypothetical protein